MTVSGPLAGHTALVTGASRGIGEATARVLVGAGARVARVARRLPDDERFVDLPGDLSRADEVTRIIEQLITTVGVPDVVINNAGTFLYKSLEATAPDEFETTVRVNLTAAFLVLRELVPHLRRVGRGHVVTVGSVADHRAFSGNAAYAASKWGLRGLHGVFDAELREAGIRSTLVSPGPTDTSMWDAVNPDASPGLLPRAAMMSPEDVAEAILFVVTRPPRANVDLLRINPTG